MPVTLPTGGGTLNFYCGLYIKLMFSPGLLDAIYAVAGARSNKKLFRKRSLRVYEKNVKTYADLLLTNLAFLHGKMMVFYNSYIGLEEGHQQSAGVNALIKLHEHGVFTDDGQGNDCFPDQRQRSYVNGMMPLHSYDALQKELEKRDDVWFQFFYVFGGLVDTNMTPDTFTDMHRDGQRRVLALTQGKWPDQPSTWQTDTVVFPERLGWGNGAYKAVEFARNLKHVEQILRTTSLMGVVVIMRDFCSSQTADQVLWQCVQAAGLPQLLVDPFAQVQGGYTQVYYGMKSSK